MIQNIYYVYGLFDPRNGDLRYIGFSNNIKNRLHGHCSPSKLKKNTHKNNWIKLLRRKKLRPQIIILETYYTVKDAIIAEMELVSYYKFIGCNLTNATDGGEYVPPYIRTPEIRQKTSKSGGHKQTKKTREQISKTLTGLKRSPKNIENISKGLKGKYVGENAFTYRNKKLPTSDDILNIKEFYFSKAFTQTEIGEIFGYSRGFISGVCKGKKDFLIK